MLTLQNASLRLGHRLLFENVTLSVKTTQKVGITGANGVGKSSLFSLIRHELSTDQGEIILKPNTEIAWVAQETPAVKTIAIDYVKAGDKPLLALTQQLHAAEATNNGEQQAVLHAQIDTINGYTADSRAARLLHGLGFSQQQQSASVDTFSGGWRMRLNLAQALMCRSDLLLLDEPTNHLDLDAVVWLEDWLQTYTGTLLLISHDRDFLDQIATHIIHIDNQTLQIYKGNYQAFEKYRAAHLAQHQANYQKQQQQIAHIQAFVTRFRAKASKAKQAQSRLNALMRIEQIAPAHIDSPFDFSFKPPAQLPTPLITLAQAVLGYHHTPILNAVNFTIAPGQRIGLLGANGTGKSTFIKALAGELALQQGQRQVAQKINIGYFAQHQLEQLHLDQSPLQHVQQLDPQASESSSRQFLGGFNFRGNMALEPITTFSGGEKARLVLALIVYQSPNLLLLDEPTNHLDLDMRHALSMALQTFEGAVIVISHDRHLLRTICDEFYLVADQHIQPFAGDLSDYHQILLQQKSPNPSNRAINDSANQSSIDRKTQRRLDAELRRQSQPLRHQITKIEQHIQTLTDQKQAIETQLGDSSLYEPHHKTQLKALLAEQAQFDTQLAIEEEAWLQASETLEMLHKNTTP